MELQPPQWYAMEDEVLRDDTPVSDTIRDLMRVCRAEVNYVCAHYDVPFEAEDITLAAETRFKGSVKARAGPYGCGRYTVFDYTYRVGSEPDGYLVALNCVSAQGMSEFDVRDYVRHELAHVAGWATEKVTYEGVKNHEEWCHRLDTA